MNIFYYIFPTKSDVENSVSSFKQANMGQGEISVVCRLRHTQQESRNPITA